MHLLFINTGLLRVLLHSACCLISAPLRIWVAEIILTPWNVRGSYLFGIYGDSCPEFPLEVEPTTDDSSECIGSDFEQGQNPQTIKNSKIYFKYLILNSNLDVPVFATAREDTISVVCLMRKQCLHVGWVPRRKASGDCTFLFLLPRGQFMSQAAFKRDDFWFIWAYPQLPCCPVAGKGALLLFKWGGF